MLSGGIDSTLIAALATEISSTGVETFTVGYDVGDVSETGPAQQVADALGTTHHTLTIQSRSMLDGVPALLRAMDQPLADHALIAIHAVAGFARERVKVAIGGEGADELFAGYPRYVWLSRADRLGTQLPAGVLRSLAGMARHGAGSRAARLSQILAPQSGIARHADWVTAGRLQTRRGVYGPRLLDQVAPDDSLARLSTLAASISAESTIGHFMQLDQRHWLPDDVLVKADRASMLVSLELRTPYLHPQLAELAATLPPEDHSGNGGKSVLRAVLHRRASRSIVRRPKAAFAVPVREWLRGPLLPFVDETLANGVAFEDRWLDRDAVRVLRDQHAAGHDRHNLLWPVVCFAAWLDGWHGRV
jgi:asparagine synthase (glutamine-hydrolysing)